MNETDDASLVSGLARTKSLLQPWILFKPNVLTEECDFFYQFVEMQYSEALCLQVTLRAFQSDGAGAPLL